jgi:hypothetical protein
MCFSKEVSLATFIIGILGGILCYSVNLPDYKIIGLFFAFVSLMQGIEYLLWSHQKCDDYNKFLTNAGMILNHLQPIVLFLLLLIYNRNKIDSKITLLILVYTICITLYSLQLKNECTLKNNNGNLIWEWNKQKYSGVIYLLFLTCFIVSGLYFPNIKYGIAFSIYSLLSYILSSYIYFGTHVIGSMWCFFAVFSTYIFYILK